MRRLKTHSGVVVPLEEEEEEEEEGGGEEEALRYSIHFCGMTSYPVKSNLF